MLIGRLSCAGEFPASRHVRHLQSLRSLQTSVSERRDTVTELPPLTGGSGNSAGSGRRASRPQPAPRGGTLQGRSDLFARLPAVLRTRSGGPLEVWSGHQCMGMRMLNYGGACTQLTFCMHFVVRGRP